MAWNNGVERETLKALFDCTGLQYRIVELATTEVNALTNAGLGGGYGVLVTEPKLNEFGSVARCGQVQVRVGSGGLAIGDEITSAASGWATKVVSGMAAPIWVLGYARSAAASGSIATLEMCPYRIRGVSSAGLLNA
jgi:hypothetical protein